MRAGDRLASPTTDVDGPSEVRQSLGGVAQERHATSWRTCRPPVHTLQKFAHRLLIVDSTRATVRVSMTRQYGYFKSARNGCNEVSRTWYVSSNCKEISLISRGFLMRH